MYIRKHENVLHDNHGTFCGLQLFLLMETKEAIVNIEPFEGELLVDIILFSQTDPLKTKHDPVNIHVFCLE